MSDTTENVKVSCFSARNVEEARSAYLVTVVEPSFKSVRCSGLVCAVWGSYLAESWSDEWVVVATDGIFVGLKDPDIEPSDHTSVAKAADSAEEVTGYTVEYLIGYSEVTSIWNEVYVVSPIVVADSVVAHANRLICPIDGGEPGSGRETGTLI